jgi:hypothetical protein
MIFRVQGLDDLIELLSSLSQRCRISPSPWSGYSMASEGEDELCLPGADFLFVFKGDYFASRLLEKIFVPCIETVMLTPRLWYEPAWASGTSQLKVSPHMRNREAGTSFKCPISKFCINHTIQVHFSKEKLL